jgi:hypothetical protein
MKRTVKKIIVFFVVITLILVVVGALTQSKPLTRVVPPPHESLRHKTKFSLVEREIKRCGKLSC